MQKYLFLFIPVYSYSFVFRIIHNDEESVILQPGLHFSDIIHGRRHGAGI